MKKQIRMQQAYDLRKQGFAPKQAAEIMGITPAGVTSLASKWEKKLRKKPVIIVISDSLAEENRQLKARVAQLESEKKGMYEPSARDDTNWDIWDKEYNRLQQLDRMIVVHSINDMHIPDEDEQCINMDLEINAAVQPDITIFGGDMYDFDVLSLKYKRMYNRRRKDPFLEVEPRWNDIVTTIKDNNPNGIILATGDNHGQQRMEKFINEWIPVFGDRLTADYNALVRCNNLVLWLGWTQEVYMQNTIFEHGKRAGANPAMANFKFHGESFNDVAGHAHRWQQIVSVKQMWLPEEHRMLYYPLTSVVTGCSQHVPPHYITDTKSANSTQGSAITHVNLHGLDSHVQNILYHPRVDGSLVAAFGTQVFKQEAVKATA